MKTVHTYHPEFGHICIHYNPYTIGLDSVLIHVFDREGMDIYKQYPKHSYFESLKKQLTTSNYEIHNEVYKYWRPS